MKRTVKKSFTVLLLLFWLFTGWPPLLQNPAFPLKTKVANASTFSMQTGYYVGNTNPVHITGLGFKPQLVIIKSDTNTSGAVFSTTLMPGPNTAFFIATADNTTGQVNLEVDGFTVSSTMSTANIRYTWIAFTGADCSSSGTFCIGAYSGNGNSTQSITSVGFQPDLVWVKQTTAVAGNWRSSSMGTNVGQYFAATAQDTTGALFTTLDSTGFTVGTTNNASGGIYYYVAFKNSSGAMKVGSYSGTGSAHGITGVGFSPDWVFVKNADAVTPVSAVYNTNESYGDNSSLFTATANSTGVITSLDSDGFSVGTNSMSNGSGNTIYYAAFAGASSLSPGSGTFKMESGTYTGTGSNIIVSNLGFSPDLIIIKGDTAQYGVFRTSMMGGDSTAYFGNAVANFSGGIIAINPKGFTVGTNATVNSAGATYYWVAYGNAWNPAANSGASDFYIGAYYGNGADNRNITRLPFQADMVTVKRSGATAGVFRTSAQAGDTSALFTATADTANNVQSLTSDGFQVGTTANVNTAANVYWYFGFKNGSEFKVGQYGGNGSSQNITSVGFQPDNIWIKRSGTTQSILRTSDGAANSSLPFLNAANVNNAVTSILSNGFSVGSAAEANTNSNTYWYVAWKDNFSPTTPTFKMQTGYYIGNTNPVQITGLGFRPQLVILKSDSNTLGAMFSTTLMPGPNTSYFISTADNTTGWVNLEDDGFTVSGTQSTANVRVTWIAFAGSDCSASGMFCIGEYQGDGNATKSISNVGFQPDLTWIKRSTAVTGTFRTSSMGTNVGQYFDATAQDTTGALFTTLDSTGFTVGTTNNASGGIYYFVAFKNTANAVKVGSYSGTGSAHGITGVGFSPDWVFVKNADAVTPVSAVYNTPESYGNNSSLFTKTANSTGVITSLDSDGFSVGTNSMSNGSGNTIYYAAFGGASDHSSSGSFEMAKGTYTGNGAYQRITNLGFQPDLIIIKGDTAQAGVFRTSMMGGDSTAYLDSATANLAGAITAINPNGFTVGTSTTANSTGVTYYWVAYGNAWNPMTATGASDFYIGAYYGNGIDNTNIGRLPLQADMVTVKRSGATGGTFRSSSQAGDTSAFFAATNDTANNIQTLNSDGFQIGTTANVNTAANIYWYFGFKTGTNFKVGSYSGTGSSHGVSSVGLQPDYLWVKRSAGTATRGIQRTSDGVGNFALPFINVASITNAITSLDLDGFSVGTASETNASSTTYWYVAWGGLSTVISVSVADGTVSYGVMSINQNKDTTASGLNDTQTATNNGNVAEDFNISGQNTSCPWTLSSSSGTDQYVHSFSTNSGSNWTPLTTSYQALGSGNLAANGTQAFDLKLTTPTSTACSSQQSVDVTIQAVAH
ncbi:MAG TPA: hypothetical protein VG917_01725 [Patescibacteria group bacterium]|nr:hypothetical protein [Patescibacteria group bacterium]